MRRQEPCCQKIAAQALSNSLTGFEFASGYKDLGGAVMMNAGAYGGEMKHVLESADADLEENFDLISGRTGTGYQNKCCGDKRVYSSGRNDRTRKRQSEEIKAYMDDLKERRITSSHWSMPVREVHLRDRKAILRALIQDSGLKGYSVGDAQIREAFRICDQPR